METDDWKNVELVGLGHRNVDLALRSYLEAEARGQIIESRGLFEMYVPAPRPDESQASVFYALAEMRLALAERF